MSFVSSKGNILCRLINIELYKIFAIINRAIQGLHCSWNQLWILSISMVSCGYSAILLLKLWHEWVITYHIKQWYIITCPSPNLIWGLWCQKLVSQAWISNCIPQYSVRCNDLFKSEIPAPGTKVFIQTLLVNKVYEVTAQNVGAIDRVGNTVGCNYLSMSEISISGTKVFNINFVGKPGPWSYCPPCWHNWQSRVDTARL